MDTAATTGRSSARSLARSPGDAALDLWVRESLRRAYADLEQTPECLLRLCAAAEEPERRRG